MLSVVIEGDRLGYVNGRIETDLKRYRMAGRQRELKDAPYIQQPHECMHS